MSNLRRHAGVSRKLRTHDLGSLRAALSLLTRLPAGRAVRPAAGLGYFPLVGVIVAAVGVGVWMAVEVLLGPLAAAVASVLATVVVTGALHEDGLADTADGLWGGSTAQRRLEIMRDSRLGTFGAVALVGDLLLRTVLMVPLDLPDVARVLVAGHVIGRAAPLVLAAWLPPARADGLGAQFGRPRWGGVVLATVTVVVAAIVAAGAWAVIPVLAAAVAVAAIGWSALRRIGGYTGDVLGAGVLLANLAVAVSVVALIRPGWV